MVGQFMTTGTRAARPDTYKKTDIKRMNGIESANYGCNSNVSRIKTLLLLMYSPCFYKSLCGV